MKLKNYVTLALALGAFKCSVAQQRKVSLQVRNLELKKALDQIQEISGYNILYSDEVVKDSMLVSVDVVQQPVAQVLNTILTPKNLFYTLRSRDMIVIGSLRLREKEQVIQATSRTVNGRVVDPRGNGVPFASVALTQGGSILAGSTSNEAGWFILNYNFRDKDIYELKISSVGYKGAVSQFVFPDTLSLKSLVLAEDQGMLNMVTINSKRQLVERKTDRYIVNVEGTVLADGSTGLEVLQRAPGIWVSSDGAIKIKGNQSVMVMINDVVQRMSESDLADYLRSLRSEDIKKIEVISSPPSEFEASGSGGIIHIVLKKSRNDGLTGTVGAVYKQQERKPYFGTSVSADYKHKNLYVFGNTSYAKDKSQYYAQTDNTYADQSTYTGKTDRDNDNGRTMYRVGMAYDLSKNQVIGLQGIHTVNNLLQSFQTGIELNNIGQPLLTGNSISEWVRKPVMKGATLNYLLRLDSIGSVFKVIGDYVHSTKSELNEFNSMYSDAARNSRYRNNTPNVTEIYSLQADYTRNFGNQLELKSGMKYAATKRDNTVLSEDYVNGNWVLDPGISNQFIYDEKLAMAYVSLEKTIHRTSFKIGFRGEETFMKGNSVTSGQTFSRNYFGLFPSMYILQKLKKEGETAIYLSYSRRIARPQFSDLNPYRLHFDDYLVQIGNPDLLPEYTNKIELGYNFWKGFSADVYYRRTENTIAQLVNPIADNVIEYQVRNFDSRTDFGLTLDAPINPFKWWSMNNSVVFFHLSSAINDFKVDQYSVYLKSMQVINVKKWFDLDVFASYNSPYVRANSKMGYIFTVDMGLTKKLFENRVRARFGVTDIFDTFREKDVTNYKGTRIDFYQKRPTRTFGFSLSYNFSSGQKFKNKKIEQSNEEEKNRIGN
jgi:outer membrane receptor protein involved in Fe transport